MKISFCSNFHGQGAVTSNVLAVSTIFAKEYKQKVILTQTHFDKNNLQRSLLGSSFDDNDIVQFDNTGIDALIRYSKQGPITDQIVNNCSVSLYKQQLNFVSGTSKKNREVYMKDMISRYAEILNALDRLSDYVFIDTNSGDDELTRITLDESDIVVANFSQNTAVIEEYFTNDRFKQYLNKTVFLIGNYDCNSRYNVNNLSRSIKDLKRDKVAVIPYNVEYLDAQCDGKVLDFFEKNLESSKNDNNYYFIKSVNEAAKLIKRAESRINREAV